MTINERKAELFDIIAQQSMLQQQHQQLEAVKRQKLTELQQAVNAAPQEDANEKTD